jgi:hypothetical protein
LYYNYGLTSESAGATDRARRAYRRALLADPGHEPSFRRIATLMYSSREFDSLLVVLDAWILSHPDDSMGPLLRAEVEGLMKQPASPAGAPEAP